MHQTVWLLRIRMVEILYKTQEESNSHWEPDPAGRDKGLAVGFGQGIPWECLHSLDFGFWMQPLPVPWCVQDTTLCTELSLGEEGEISPEL